VANIGTTAIFYNWHRVPWDLHPNASTGAERWFYLHDQKGVMLPGSTKDFLFTFQPKHPGIFRDKYVRFTCSMWGFV
jgi:hypothetical protein